MQRLVLLQLFKTIANSIQLFPEGKVISDGYIAISRKVVRKKVHATIPKGSMGCGAFHLSELTGQLIPIVMGISLLINNKPSRSVKSYTLCSKEMVFQQILLEKACFISKMPGLAMVRPGSSDL